MGCPAAKDPKSTRKRYNLGRPPEHRPPRYCTAAGLREQERCEEAEAKHTLTLKGKCRGSARKGSPLNSSNPRTSCKEVLIKSEELRVRLRR